MVFSPAKWAKPQITTTSPRRRLQGLVIFSLLSLFTIAYLFLVGSISTTGYQIRSLEKTVSSLKTESANLEVQSASMQSLNQYQNIATMNGFVAVDKIEYLSAVPTSSGVAVR